MTLTPLSDEQIAEIDALFAKATPGKREYHAGKGTHYVVADGLVGRAIMARFTNDPEGRADARLDAALVNAWPSIRSRLAQADRSGFERGREAAAQHVARALYGGHWLVGTIRAIPYTAHLEGEKGEAC